MQYQHHHGKKFYLDKKTGYWISTTCPKVRAHVWVWINEVGEIEPGFHIHHIDEDKSNNFLSNLSKMSSREHLSMHMTEERRRLSRELMEIIRPLTKEWHSSEEGIEWHKKNGLKSWEKRMPFQEKCAVCGTVFSTKTYHQEFCSNNCKSEARRRSGVDDILDKCGACGKEFKRNKYAKRKFCTRSCANKQRKNKVD